MIILDTALKQRALNHNPIRVGLIGTGAMGVGILNQITNHTTGMVVSAIYNRTIKKAIEGVEYAGISNFDIVSSKTQLEKSIQYNRIGILESPELIYGSESIDAVVDVTGSIEFSANLVLKAIEAKKHIILMNAELDATIGPILKVYADKSGVVYTNVDGDQPGVEMNLYRSVKSMGFRPVLCGNIKGLHDPYRNPTTQKGFAEKWNQNPYMVTSFADGTKISFEQALVANATGMKVAKRGMLGPKVEEGAHLKDVFQDLYPKDYLEVGPGIVDYVIGAAPAPGVFLIAKNEDPRQHPYLDLYKAGKGPYYLFYNPYHLCHFEVPMTIARAVLFKDAAVSPLGKPLVDVISVAKKDLKKNEKLDGIGGYMTYGMCENYDQSVQNSYVPMGLIEGCILKNDISKDQPITYKDIDVPRNRISDKLRQEQLIHFA
jgi:predicted homoserine dehydrogenase-like protein